MATIGKTRVRGEDDRFVTLAIEYYEKLHLMNKSLSEYYKNDDNDNFNSAFEYVKRLTPVADDLAQAISQQIEHGTLDSSSKLVLRLRLAELESSINSSKKLMSEYMKFYKWTF